MTRGELERRFGRALNKLATGADSVPWDADVVPVVEAAMSAVDAYVQAERERIAQAIEAIPVEYKHGNDRYPGYVRTEAARIARAES